MKIDDPELGTMKVCPGCGEAWPLDEEFFFHNGHRGWASRCKACWSEQRAQARLRQAVPV